MSQLICLAHNILFRLLKLLVSNEICFPHKFEFLLKRHRFHPLHRPLDLK